MSKKHIKFCASVEDCSMKGSAEIIMTQEVKIKMLTDALADINERAIFYANTSSELMVAKFGLLMCKERSELALCKLEGEL